MSYEPSMTDDARRWQAVRKAIATQDERITDYIDKQADVMTDESLTQEQRERVIDDTVDAFIRETAT